MNTVLNPVGLTKAGPPPDRDPTKYVRKHWLIFAAYYAATSSAVGLGIVVMLVLSSALHNSKHGKLKPIHIHSALMFSLAVLGMVSVVIFLIQLISGPFVITKDVVCKKCHTRWRVDRIPFFRGKYSRPPKCECGGHVEPAFLWTPVSGATGANN